MNILFYRFNNIYEADVISAFRDLGINVIEERAQMEKRIAAPGDAVDLVAQHIMDNRQRNTPLLFVFSVNYIPALSEVCQLTNTLYVCWTVDCPVVELFHKSICNKCNRIFLFDKAQFQRFAPYNPNCIFYLPLGANVERIDRTVASVSSEDRLAFSSEISFVGSLFSEVNPFRRISGLDDYTKGYIDGLIEAQMKVYGYNFMEDSIPSTLIDKLKEDSGDFSDKDFVEPIDRYIAAHTYVNMELAQTERIRTLSALSKDFHIKLYTQSDATVLPDVHVCGPANSFKETPKIYHLSKINLNITHRSIQTGLPLRIFDVLGAGGFLITNYQEELEDFFEIGRDLEVYSSLDELYEKCTYYLSHGEERETIAGNGCEKVKNMHTVQRRVAQIISGIMNTL